ncbi:hypothetical protein V492_02521 [Pseudogymnoascus sp. VKM F-4246]|nr:hypothetical protein V492_02521 [Pseudogymnoascus sp. VKM F-4246]
MALVTQSDTSPEGPASRQPPEVPANCKSGLDGGPAARRSAYEGCARFPELGERRTGAAQTWTPRASAAVGVVRRMEAMAEIPPCSSITNYHNG